MRKTGLRVVILISLPVLTLTLLSGIVLAKLGVGVNTGTIQVDEKLKGGMIYNLPSITVINTGDEAAEYRMSVSYQKDQKLLAPDKAWLDFSPDAFDLEGGKTQVVEIKIKLPLRSKPGDYFAYLEARPIATVNRGGTAVGVAAASKLYFTVAPANAFLGMYYRIASMWTQYMPWSQVIVGLMAFALILSIFKKFVRLEIKAKPAKKSPSKEESSSNSNS